MTPVSVQTAVMFCQRMTLLRSRKIKRQTRRLYWEIQEKIHRKIWERLRAVACMPDRAVLLQTVSPVMGRQMATTTAVRAVHRATKRRAARVTAIRAVRKVLAVRRAHRTTMHRAARRVLPVRAVHRAMEGQTASQAMAHRATEDQTASQAMAHRVTEDQTASLIMEASPM